MNVEVNPNEDTEWNDILRSHGIIPEREPSPDTVLENAIAEAMPTSQAEIREMKARALVDAHVRAAENRAAGAGSDDDDLSGLEDELDDDFMSQYRQQRMDELRGMQAEREKREKFGSVYPVSKPEYKTEITDVSAQAFVFVHMSSLSGNVQSRLLARMFTEAAALFKDVKFVDIAAQRAVEGYPERNCPTLLVYKDGDVRRQLVTLREIGGDQANIRELVRFMVAVGAVGADDARAARLLKQAAAVDTDSDDD
ncbi:Phosducin-like protein 2 [Dipodascopsis tothii]|uniref:Phosducin-like protein 2 n=1 Tax=Dipodascopsis tothii TaxID=44089 RepID=UPI0034CD6E16